MISGQVSKMIGARVRRKEDPRLITGEGKYTDDVQLPNMAHISVLRSLHAHALIKAIDVSDAVSQDGVIGVFTGKEINGMCTGPVPLTAVLDDMKWKDRMPMASDKVHFVGEAVAVVVAISRDIARDAIDLIDVDYEPIPPVVDMEKAGDAESPLVHEELGTNIAYAASDQAGDPDKAFSEADGVVSARLVQPRLIPNPMEPRAVVANYDKANGHMDLWSTTQNPHIERDNIAKVIGFSLNKLRVISIDVGGGFGCKINTYSEPIIAALLSKKLRRPMKWVEERQENFIATAHGRGQIQYVDVSYKNDGTVTGMKLRIYADLGAFCQVLSHAIPTLTPSLAPGIYMIKDMAWTTYGMYTNKVPYDAYRGAGRPEGAYIIERAMDLVSQKLGMDPAEIRRKNFIPKDSFPYETPTGMEYDSGDYELALDKVLELSKYKELRQKQRQLRKQGVLMGIGVSTTTEVCGFGPAGSLGALGGYESAVVRVNPDGGITALTGASPHGQGEETSFAQLIADDLGIPFDQVEVLHGDTDVVPRGVGTLGSRTLVVGGTAILEANQRVKEKAKKIAGALLNIDPKHVIMEDGKFHVEDIPGKYVTWQEVGSEAYDGQKLSDNIERGLEATAFWEPPGLTFPFSADVAVVMIDADTGEVGLDDYFTVFDCGNVISPMLAEGQVHGGLAQGIGQALLEEAVWDQSGQLVTGSFMDYAMPLAAEFPMFKLDNTVTPSPLNPMGAKGIGEMATIAATPTVVNAVVDALSHFGVTNIDIPIKSEKVWRIISEKVVK